MPGVTLNAAKEDKVQRAARCAFTETQFACIQTQRQGHTYLGHQHPKDLIHGHGGTL